LSLGTGVIHFGGGKTGMMYAAVLLMLLGFGLGMTSRLGALVSTSALLVVPSVAVSCAHGLGVLDTALAAMAIQTIVQSCFFGGSLVRILGESPVERRLM
jgi:hypothetical protein